MKLLKQNIDHACYCKYQLVCELTIRHLLKHSQLNQKCSLVQHVNHIHRCSSRHKNSVFKHESSFDHFQKSSLTWPGTEFEIIFPSTTLADPLSPFL